MPRSRLESSIVLLGVVALGLLVWLSVMAWQRYDRRRDSSAVATITARAMQPRTVALQPGKLTLTATRGNCWMVVRAGSATGHELFSGILAKSHSLSFSGRRFWLSLGAATNLDARFNSHPLKGFPTGTATVAIDGPSARLIG